MTFNLTQTPGWDRKCTPGGPHLQAGVGLLPVSDLHHVGLAGQGHQGGQALAGVGQSAVDVELHVHVVTVKPAQPQDDGVAPPIGQVGVLQVDGVDLPVGSDVADQDWRRRRTSFKVSERVLGQNHVTSGCHGNIVDCHRITLARTWSPA